LSVEILQLQNIPFENQSPGPIVWHYLRDPMFSVTDTHKQTDGQTHDDGMYRAYHSIAR